jgi:hypothetical protein
MFGARRAPYEPTVMVGTAPNVPIAEMIVSELEQNGVVAFLQGAGYAWVDGSSETSPLSSCDVYVARRDAEDARAFFPSAHAKAARTVQISPLENADQPARSAPAGPAPNRRPHSTDGQR